MRFAPLFFTLFVYLIFDGFLVQIWACNFDVLAAFGHLFGTLFSQMQRECFLVDFGIDFGSLLAPIWPALAPIWQPLAPFWIPFGSNSVTERPSFSRPTKLGRVVSTSSVPYNVPNLPKRFERPNLGRRNREA